MNVSIQCYFVAFNQFSFNFHVVYPVEELDLNSYIRKTISIVWLNIFLNFFQCLKNVMKPFLESFINVFPSAVKTVFFIFFVMLGNVSKRLNNYKGGVDEKY